MVLDIETKPIKAYTWGIRDVTIPLEFIIEDWSVLAASVKWLGEKKIWYWDLRGQKDLCNDKWLVKELWQKIDEADVILTQNGKGFDEKKLNEKFMEYKMGPPSPYRHIDTLVIKRNNTAMTSHKLAFSTPKFNRNHKKLDHGRFPGNNLWVACIAGVKRAWDEMRKYNIADVLALEELYVDTLRPWDKTINHSVYSGDKHACMNCGDNKSVIRRGFVYTKAGKFQAYHCRACLSWSTGKDNLLPKPLKKNLKK